jgi:hypothetical protein
MRYPWIVTSIRIAVIGNYVVRAFVQLFDLVISNKELAQRFIV